MLRVWLLFDFQIIKSILLKMRQGHDFTETDSSFQALNASQNRWKTLCERNGEKGCFLRQGR